MTTRPLALLSPVLLLLLAGAGCATQTKVLQAPHYSLAYPEFWKVDAVAKKDGEPTRITIGKFSDTVISGSEEVAGDSIYEKSQAEVEARVYTWPVKGDLPDPVKKVSELLMSDPDLKLDQQALISQAGEECGGKFQRQFTILKQSRAGMDLLSRPGHRLILIGGREGDLLLGVVTRVPYEQDVGLYCHNLGNMRIQLQNLLDAVTLGPPPPAQ
jgi:hypothetical protein